MVGGQGRTALTGDARPRPDVRADQLCVPAMRGMLYASGVLVALAGVSLYVFSDTTAETFAWTIAPPLTAAFLGAGYWAACALELLAARERIWARARIAVPAVWLFTLLTLAATLLHIERFHFEARLPFTVIGTWVWMVVYVSVPILLGMAWLIQLRASGADPPPSAPMSRPVRALLVVECVVALGAGIALFVVPEWASAAWPWKLTPLTARAAGAWGIGVGCLIATVLRENDWMRVRPAMWFITLYPILQAVALLRYPETPVWSNTPASAYVLFLAVLLATGTYGVYMGRRSARSISAA